MDSVVSRGVIENLMALHSAWPCSNDASAKPKAQEPELKTKKAEARNPFFDQLDFADKLEKKLAAKKAVSSSKNSRTDSDSGTESTSASDDSLGEPSETPANRMPTMHSRPTLIDPEEKKIPPIKLGAAAIIGMQNARSGAAMTLTVMRLAEAGKSANTGEAITTLVLSVLSIVGAIFNAGTAAKNLADNAAREETLNSVLIRTKEQARNYFKNCLNNQDCLNSQESSAEEAQAYGEFIAAASQHRKFSEKGADSTFLTRLVMAKETCFLALAGLNLTQGILLWAAIPVAAVSAVVLGALTVGLGLVANAYEIVQGIQGLVAADQRKKKAEAIQNKLSGVLEQDKESINPELAKGIVSFYAKDAQHAENEASFAFLRIARGIIGVVVASLGAALIFMTGGALAPAAAVLGTASSIPFFAGLATKLYMEYKELKAAQIEKEAWLALVKVESDSPLQSEVQIDYSNRYIMAYKFAKALADSPKIEETSGLGKILSAIGFTELELKLLAGMREMEGTPDDKIYAIEVILAKKMGITP